MKTRVGVLMGGYSSEYVISIQSGNTVLENLDSSIFEAYALHILEDRWVMVADGQEYPIDKNTFTVNYKNQTLHFDVLFNAIHGKPGEDGQLQGYLEMMHLKHSSCDQFEAALTFNKAECNRLLKSYGIPVANSLYFHGDQNISPEEVSKAIGYPCFVKPSRSGSSFGVSRVNEEAELEKAIAYARSEDHRVVIEKAIIGTEVGCGIARIDGSAKVINTTEIVPKKAFFDYEAKYEGASEEITPARLDPAILAEIHRLTLKVYEELNLKGIVRADYIVEKSTGQPYFIEVNTVPGLSPASIVPQQIRSIGMELKDFFTLVLRETMKNA